MTRQLTGRQRRSTQLKPLLAINLAIDRNDRADRCRLITPVNQFELFKTTSMSLSKGVEVHYLTSFKAGMLDFYDTKKSDETMLVGVPPETIDNFFVHKYQTD